MVSFLQVSPPNPSIYLSSPPTLPISTNQIICGEEYKNEAPNYEIFSILLLPNFHRNSACTKPFIKTDTQTQKGTTVSAYLTQGVWNTVSRKHGTKGFLHFGIFWILGLLAKTNYKICKFNNSRHLLTVSVPKQGLKRNSELASTFVRERVLIG